MKKVLLSCLVLSIAFLSALTSNVATTHGEDDVITDEQVQVIRNRCTDIQATLDQLHKSDILLRVDRGTLYQSVSSKLMVPLNQRIASNKLDGGNLVKLTADYNAAYKQFYDAYKAYESVLSETITIDCVKQPTSYYDGIINARQKRLELHEASQRLVTLATQYKQEFDAFKSAQGLK